MSQNRLAGASSPYLLQHAHNPVHWWPWCDEAFEEARRRDVPVFLSIGYSTCYWCHVMERESFEDEGIARQMNDQFVCIKLDREERPDLDELYMAATITLTGRGGWPMSVFLDPSSRKPFWCGTYFPPRPTERLAGMPAFTEVMQGMTDAWVSRRDEVLEQSEKLADAVRGQVSGSRTPASITDATFADAVSALLQIYDTTDGGFGGAPKFPQPSLPELLLSARPAADEATRILMDRALTHTLDAMATGGLFDQVGGGFHRYCVDATWTVPHFEKMLYDNAMLLGLYARASRTFDDAYYAHIARRTVAFIKREMVVEGGGLASALDAEVDGREGLNYLWSPIDLGACLSEDDAAFAANVYGVTKAGNFQDPHHPDAPPATVATLGGRPDVRARELDLSESELLERIARLNATMLAHRDTRKQPGRDDKVIAMWNGLAIDGLCAAADLLDDEDARALAVGAGRFLAEHVLVGEGDPTLVRRSVRAGDDGVVTGPDGTLEDYGAVALGFLALAKTDSEGAWRELAARVIDAAVRRFGDGIGGFYDTPERAGDLFVRARTTHDGATPSGASLVTAALLRQAAMSGDETDRDRALNAVQAISGPTATTPVAGAMATAAILDALSENLFTLEDVDFAPGEVGETPSESPLLPKIPPIEIYADTDRVIVGEGHPAALNVLLNIPEGLHLVASDPGEVDGMQPFRIGLLPGSGTGVTVYADYPRGEPYGEDGKLRVYKGRFEITVMVERNHQDWAGRPMLGASYQCCTETECLPVTTVELDVAVDEGTPA
ncbi:MAG: thioredoxin domain-containing protein [Planctomycetota bacterium]